MSLSQMTGLPLPWSALLAVLLVLQSGLPASAQVHPQIETVLVGLPAGSGNQESGRYRPGAWTPVYLKIKAGKEGNPRDAYRLLLQSADAEQTAYTYPVALPALAAGQDHIAIGYLRPGTNLRELNVTLLTQDGKTVQSTSRAGRDGGSDMVAPQALLAVAVGARLNNLRSALDMVRTGPKKPAAGPAKPVKDVPLQGGGKIPEDLLPDQAVEDDPDDAGSRRFAYLERVEQLPDRWFGYEAADVLVLVTGNKEFTTQLLEDQTGRCQALLEWVRRGGRLILSVSSNHQLVSELLDKKLPLLDCPIKGSLPIPQLNNLQNWVGGEGVLKKVEVAQLQPSAHVHAILQEQSGGKARPVIVQGSCGLGRVVLVGFDLDVVPFTTWNEKSRRKFWDQLLQEVLQQPLKDFQGDADNLAPRGGLPVMARGQGNAGQSSVDLLTTLQRELETFDELPVINFAWVTLFILIYILIVGPLDYFVLKKLFKRLELTWITFPSLVLLVSFLAYLIAYRSKGDDLHVNKIDLVEYDLEANQAYGTSWFTVFSPRVQRYTLADQPAAPLWAAPQPKEQPPGLGTMLTTLTATEALQRINPPGLFPQPYAYAEDAVGIENLSIPVWSMRSFTSSWRRPLPSAPPGIEANIDRGRTPRPLPRGNIINHLPVDLDSVTLFYGGKLYQLGNLAAGEERSIDALFDDPKKELDRTEWLREQWQPGNAQQQGGNNFAQQFHEASSYALMKRILFNGEGGQRSRNSGLRNLDQTWRIRPQLQVPPAQAVYRPEIILVARVAPQWGKAEAINSDAASATRLWLGQLAGPGEPPTLPGVLANEVYLRVYIPVK
jgi:hypothetical protein